MNIYHIGWVQSKCFGLSAVVVAKDKEEALKVLNLDNDDEEIKISLAGVCIGANEKAHIMCRESL